ncbi:NAD(P)H-dependent oxidoreductase [Rhodoplanes serenus]|uniref:NAD(P)H-dependent oxidoreductase n=1 Tax=Rhodoplanes serenus TaxID=200615 RepID=UPI000DAD4DAC|nr:NAD(P)H-dependent oxidoreductase [Rhodoplanes serenus]RAI29416.1 NAD(P)H dehydrogenase [Rhodoplanes serenus]
MRVLVIYAHPVETSFNAAVHARAVAALREAGHTVDDCDLYAEGFDPVLSRSERIDYHDTAVNRRPVQAHVDRLLAAEALVLVFPVWCFGLPAILKGWFDRVLMPGVAFDISDPANVRPALTHLRRIAAVTTYGRSRWTALLMGDPPRKVITRYLRVLTGGRAKITYTAHYHMNVSTDATRTAHLEKVARVMKGL